MPELTERDREILAFERTFWHHQGAKEQAARDRFDLSAVRYWQRVNALLDRPEAMAYDAMLVKRLLRMRASRKRTNRLRSVSG